MSTDQITLHYDPPHGWQHSNLHALEIPVVRAFKFGRDRSILKCPFCGEKHVHALGDGVSEAHCDEKTRVTDERGNQVNARYMVRMEPLPRGVSLEEALDDVDGRRQEIANLVRFDIERKELEDRHAEDTRAFILRAMKRRGYDADACRAMDFAIGRLSSRQFMLLWRLADDAELSHGIDLIESLQFLVARARPAAEEVGRAPGHEPEQTWEDEK